MARGSLCTVCLAVGPRLPPPSGRVFLPLREQTFVLVQVSVPTSCPHCLLPGRPGDEAVALVDPSLQSWYLEPLLFPDSHQDTCLPSCPGAGRELLSIAGGRAGQLREWPGLPSVEPSTPPAPRKPVPSVSLLPGPPVSLVSIAHDSLTVSETGLLGEPRLLSFVTIIKRN